MFVNRLTPTVERIAKIVEHPIPAVVDIGELFDRKECCQLCFYIDDEMEQKSDVVFCLNLFLVALASFIC